MESVSIKTDTHCRFLQNDPLYIRKRHKNLSHTRFTSTAAKTDNGYHLDQLPHDGLTNLAYGGCQIQ